MTHFFIHNSFHNGDVILTRPVIHAIRTNFPDAKITLECTETCSYLWRDLELPLFFYQGSEYAAIDPTPNCPMDAVFINLWFGVFDDILTGKGMTYQNNVDTFNRQIRQNNLGNKYLLPESPHTPMISFTDKPFSKFEVKENSILVENGQALSNQNYFYLNEHMKRLSSDFPELNFFCSAKPLFQSPNIFDCSGLNLISLSHLGDKCVGFLMKGSAVNAATLTEVNRFKPRCIVGWDLPVKLWSDEEYPVLYAEKYDQVKWFLGKFLRQDSSSSVFVPSEHSLCKFLRSEDEVNKCTEYLHKNGYVSHIYNCKDWDIAHIISDLSDGNFLDMGSSESYILKNAVLKNIKGEKYGIDLRPPDTPVEGVKYIVGDLMDTKLPDQHFANITCLSVIEHEVDVRKLASEVSRLLANKGKLYLTFDYWTPKITPQSKLYGLRWNILDENDVRSLIEEFGNKHLKLVDEVDWTLGEAVIREGYYSPEPGMNYTFGMLVFQKD